MAKAKHQKKKVLIGFESGHYKTLTATWKGDSVWMHFEKEDGLMIHVNKDKVEYVEDLAVVVEKSVPEQEFVGPFVGDEGGACSEE